MKKILITALYTLACLFSYVNAQSNDCFTANPFCSSNTYNFPNATSGTAPAGPNYGCLGSVPRPIWYYMEIGTSGTMQIGLSQTDNSGWGIDVDFAMWGPFSDLASGCTQVMSGGVAPLQCSFSASDTETLGLGMQGGTGTGQSTPPAAVAGQVYIVLLTNYDGDAGTIDFNQTGGTGSADCAIVNPCVINNLTGIVSACNTATNLYSVSGNVTISNPPTTGNLIATACDGTQTVIATAPFGAASYPYTLNGLNSNGAACNVTVTFTDGACSQVLNYTAPTCPAACNFTDINATIGSCEPGSVFDLTGSVQFVNAPATGQLIIQDCNGNSQTFNAPFTSPTNFTINNITADGAACSVTATFTADAACTISMNYTNTTSCNCGANIGTFTVTNDGTSPAANQYVLCFGDNIDITANGDYTPPPIANAPPLADGYDPSISWLVYTCPPTVALSPDPVLTINDDPCLLGIISSDDLNDVNDQSWMTNYPGSFTNNTVYFVPITMYNETAGYYSYVNSTMPCYHTGSPVAITYLPEITQTTTQDCQAGTVSTTVQGGAPAINGSNFTASNLQPATASFTTSTVGNNGTIVVSGLQDGDNYSFDITDANGCPITVTGTFTGVTPSGFTYPQTAYCKDAANPTPTITGATGGTFSGTAGLVINATTGVINIASTPAGTYTVTYASPGAPCNSTSTFVVTINPLPTITVPSVAICIGSTATLNASGADTYTWSPATGLSATTGASVTSTVTATQTYTITGTVTATGCTNTGTTTVTVNPLPTVNAGADVAICIGASTTLTASGASTYSWDNGLGAGASHTVSPTVTTTYTVTGTNANGCVNTDQVTVTVNPLPTVTAGADVAICIGASTTLTAGGASSYSWSNGLGSGAIKTVSPTVTTTYTVTGTDGNGCVNTDQVTVTVNPLPTISAGPDVAICAGSSTNLTASGGSTYTWDNGLGAGASHTVSPAATTTYSVTGTDANGCVNTDQVVVTVNPNPTPVISGSTEYCVGSVATVQTTQPYASYSWSNGQITPSINVTQADNPIQVTVTTAAGCSGTSATFTVTEQSVITTTGTIEICQGQSAVIHGVTQTVAGVYSNTQPSANGCDSTSNITLVVHALPTINAGADIAVCTGISVTLNATGAPTIVWSPTQTNGIPFVQPVGSVTYTATGTDIHGCVNTDQVIVTVNPLPTVSAGTDVAICIGASTTLGAFGATSYTWDNGLGAGANPTAAPTSTTAYTVTGTDANGCVNTDQVTVTVNPLPAVNAGPDVAICIGASTILNATGAATYSWSHGLGTSATPSASPTTTTTYTVTGTDANGCVNTDQVTVTVNPLPLVNAGVDVAICDGASTNLLASGANTYSWDNGLGAGAAKTVNPTTTTTYTVTGTDGNNCVNTDQVVVTVNPLPTMAQQPNLTYCNGVTTNVITLNSNIAGSTFQWTNNNTAIGLTSNGSGNILAFNATNTTSSAITATISVTPTSPLGCVGAPMSFTITVMPSPTATIANSAQVCINGTSPVVTFTGGTGTAPYTISYNINGGATQTITTTGNTATLNAPTNVAGIFNYNLVSVQESGQSCTATITGNIAITVYDLPVISAGNDAAICIGSSTTITASGAGMGGSYTWDNGLGVGASKTVNPTVTTTYTVTGTDNHGCQNTDAVVVTVNTPNGVDAGPNQTICIGENVTLNASSSDAASTFVWNNNVQNGVAFAPNQSTTYTVTATDGNGCISSDVMDVIVNSLPIIEAGNNISGCAGDQFTFTASGAGQGGTYVWSNGIQNGVPYTPQAGDQQFYVTGTDANGCVGYDSLFAKIQAFPVISFYADQEQNCAPVSATFYNTTQYPDAFSCMWYFDDGTTYNGCGPVSHVFTSPGTYGATLVVTTDLAGCQSELYLPNLVVADSRPLAHFTPNPQIGTQINNQITFVNNSYGATSYYWEFGDGIGTSNEVNPTYTYSEEVDWYHVMLVATSQGGCVDTAYADVTIQEELIFYVPNTFTPDKDQYNEVFKPIFTYGYDPYDYTLYIFDRWGEMIFESHDATVGWDGTYGVDGKICQDGTYTWKIEVKTTMNDERKTFVGHVNILR